MNGEKDTAGRWRKFMCRLGYHRFRAIPDNVRERARKGGETEPPDWYAGRRGIPKCWDCGVQS